MSKQSGAEMSLEQESNTEANHPKVLSGEYFYS